MIADGPLYAKIDEKKKQIINSSLFQKIFLLSAADLPVLQVPIARAAE